MKTIIRFYAVTALCLLTVSNNAQNYSVNWSDIGGGGGTAAGGGYSTQSVIGQPLAGGQLAGGAYSVASGFWAIYAVATTPGTPLLTIFFTDTNAVVLTWPVSTSRWTLQQSTDLASATWISLTNTVDSVSGQNQVILAAPSGNRFYRLQSH